MRQARTHDKNPRERPAGRATLLAGSSEEMHDIDLREREGFLAHLKEIVVRYSKPVARPQNNSKLCHITDSGGTKVELACYGDRADIAG